MRFQQDGATAHTARATMNLLRQHFPNHIISKIGDVRWPPCSLDLTPPDFFLWGYLKDKVYANNFQTIEALKENIRHEIAAISPETLRNAIENTVRRARVCAHERDGHLADMIFRM